jgi:hypothetical protein
MVWLFNARSIVRAGPSYLFRSSPQVEFKWFCRIDFDLFEIGVEGIQDVIGFAVYDAGRPHNGKLAIFDPLLADFTRLFHFMQIFRLLRRKEDVRRYSDLKGYKFGFQSLSAFGVHEHFGVRTARWMSSRQRELQACSSGRDSAPRQIR